MAVRTRDGSSLESAITWSERSRRRRMLELLRSFPDFRDLRVVDLGGTTAFWQQSGVRPGHVTVVNLDGQPEIPDFVTSVASDVCQTPSELDGQFDLVFSNSLIEHLGGPARRAQFAQVVARLAPSSWVQTPYRYFPIEPHWMMPGQQFLPLPLRARLSAKWRGGSVETETLDDSIQECLDVELLTRTELRHLFPGSRIWNERVWGMTKSIVAVSGAGPRVNPRL
jgi:hypothetical protein